MILLFWKNKFIASGTPINSTWFDPVTSSPRILLGTTNGFDIVSPYFYYCNSCYKILNTACNSLDYYNGNIIIGTQISGLYSIPWNELEELGVCNKQYYDGVVTQVPGIYGNAVYKVCGQSGNLGLLTTSGFEYDVGGVFYLVEGDYSDLYITNNSKTYVSSGNQILLYDGGLPTVWSGWSAVFDIPLGSITKFSVEEFDGYDNIFIGTVSGTGVLQINYTNNSYSFVDYTETISGSLHIIDITTEAEADFSGGHYFALTSTGVNVINLQKDLNSYLWEINGINSIEFSRLKRK